MDFPFMQDEPSALCACGCGQPVPRASMSQMLGNVPVGMVYRFVVGHNTRLRTKTVDGMRTCKRCGESKPATGEFFYAKDRKQNKANPWNNLRPTCKSCDCRRYSDATPEQKVALKSKQQARFKRNQAAIQAKQAAKRGVLKLEMVAAYGGKCACCGEAEPDFLTLEHINGDAVQHRKSLNTTAGGYVLYKDLKERGWPKDGYTVLCYNCNCASARGRICPHKRPKSDPPLDAT